MRFILAFCDGAGFAAAAASAIGVSISIGAYVHDLTGLKGLALMAGISTAGGLLGLLREVWK